MKKIYEKPMIEIETYVLSASIAANCVDSVTLGPEAPGYTPCRDYDGSFDVFSSGKAKTAVEVPFYNNEICDCYYSSTGGNYMTS